MIKNQWIRAADGAGRTRSIRPLFVGIAVAAMVVAPSCKKDRDFDPTDPARGPGSLVGNGDPVSDGDFSGGDDAVPAARNVAAPLGDTAPNCSRDCRDYCDSLDLENPVNRGICPYVWGAGMELRTIKWREACRRMHIDLTGDAPTGKQISSTCDDATWGEAAQSLMASDDFDLNNRRRYADVFRYDTLNSNVETIYDLDELVGKANQGLVSIDEFAAVVSAHPAFLRRFGTAADMAEGVFLRLMGRSPLDHERTDLAHLYAIWSSDYVDHAPLAMRLPDMYVQYPCYPEENETYESAVSACTSTLWGVNTVSLEPDVRSAGGYSDATMWHGLMRPDEWAAVQLPGRLLAEQPEFWEHQITLLLEHYFGYDIAAFVPEVRQELLEYLLEYNGDIRAIHFAITTSFPYLQSTTGRTGSEHTWIVGPQKPMLAEDWIQAIAKVGEFDAPLCDHRISRPGDFLSDEASATARELIDRSRWALGDEGDLNTRFSDLAKTMGGCPDNGAETRFRLSTILSVSAQLNLVNELCDPAGEGFDGSIASERLTGNVNPGAGLTRSRANNITAHLQALSLGRQQSDGQDDLIRDVADRCMNASCSSEDFARAVCFTLLSGAEHGFY